MGAITWLCYIENRIIVRHVNYNEVEVYFKMNTQSEIVNIGKNGQDIEQNQRISLFFLNYRD